MLDQFMDSARSAAVAVGNLAALYPAAFANEIVLRSALSFIAIALLTAAVAHIAVVRADRKSGTITLLQPPRLVSD